MLWKVYRESRTRRCRPSEIVCDLLDDKLNRIARTFLDWTVTDFGNTVETDIEEYVRRSPNSDKPGVAEQRRTIRLREWLGMDIQEQLGYGLERLVN